MNLIGSFVIAFSMYSRIPMPRMDWTEERMRYALCFFPLIGAVIGAVEIATFALCEILGAGVLFRTCLLTAVPLLITGGIHMDGYLDVTDARHSYGEREKKLAILKDPHTGAFAIIGLGLYLLLYAGSVSEFVGADVWLLPGALMLERACSGYSVVAFPKAKKDGLAAEFSRSAETKVVRVSMAVLAVLAISWMIYWGHLRGALAALTALATFVCYYRFSMREFGGISIQTYSSIHHLRMILTGFLTTHQLFQTRQRTERVHDNLTDITIATQEQLTFSDITRIIRNSVRNITATQGSYRNNSD